MARRVWGSTEHNLDVYAAFTRLFQITGEELWRTNAQHAREFVEAMWDGDRGCYLAGTLDPETRNTPTNQLPVDAQTTQVATNGTFDWTDSGPKAEGRRFYRAMRVP